MTAALGNLTKVIGIGSQIKDRLGQGNTVLFAVRLARIWYGALAGTILLAWYTGWRNQRTDPGEVSFPFPGASKTKVKHPGPEGASRADEDSDAPKDLAGALEFVGAAGSAVGGAGSVVAAGAAVIGTVGANVKVTEIGKLAQRWGLHVGEHPNFGGVGARHASGSYHYSGRAVDVSHSDPAKMAAFANAILQMYGARQFAELIWRGKHPVTIDNGKRVPLSFFSGHTDHVHVAI